MNLTTVSLFSLAFFALSVAAITTLAAPSTAPADKSITLPLTIIGGHETDPVDHGRPVILIAAALGVPDEVFRSAFSNVHPAPAGQSPAAEDVRRNKQVLMAALGPHGITNDRLDEVSNYYRYRPESGSLWKNVPAAATATVIDGKITAITVTTAGSGYSSPPRVSLAGMPAIKFVATLSFGKDFSRNGSIKDIKVAE